MSWTCTCDTQNLDSTRYCEFCGAEHAPRQLGVGERTGSGIAWSPPTPRLAEFDLALPKPLPPEQVEPFLQQLREIAAKGHEGRLMGQRQILTPEKVAAFHAACAAKGYPIEGLEKFDLGDREPPVRDPNKPYQRRGKSLAKWFPTTEAEERRANRG